MRCYTVEYYSAIKKNELMPFAATWIDLESIILSELSKTDRVKYHMILLICKIKKKKDTSELICITEIDPQT